MPDIAISGSAGPIQTFSDGLLEHGLVADTGPFGDLPRLFEVADRDTNSFSWLRIGEKVLLDGSWSCGDSRIARFEWTVTDGVKALGQSVERIYSQPGTYSEILKVTDGRGHTDYDFETVNVLDAQHPDQTPPSIQAAYWPTTSIAPGASVTFKVRTFGTTDGEETWSFGDGATARTKSDGNVVPLAKNGFATTTHAFQKPGDYVVRVERVNRLGQKAIAHLFVRVGGADATTVSKR